MKVEGKIGNKQKIFTPCFSCGHVKDMPLNIRTYDCPECGLSIERDLNASINLRNAVGSVVDACGRSAADSSGGSRK
ncbi:zinc ribbon domain-containing protein [Okeania sp. SIO3B5]|uniref:zinc ribbon domain-containing protein n=1 Tax=Okeania sp. SIO3B5 TaxID=2607811 RepID=UPI003454EE44